MDTERLWRISRLTTTNRIMQKINERMTHPVGLLLIGADGETKSRAVADFQSGLRNTYIFDNIPDAAIMRDLASKNTSILIILKSSESCTHGLRHECVQAMYKAGFRNVIGVFIDDNHMPHNNDTDEWARKQLLANPPTAEGLDYFISIPPYVD